MTNSIGKNIRYLRKKVGQTQQEVARILEISVPGYSKIETDITDINIGRLNQIADYFKVPLADILSGEETVSRSQEQRIITELRAKIAERDQEFFHLQAKLIDLYDKAEKKP